MLGIGNGVDEVLFEGDRVSFLENVSETRPK